MAPSTSSSPDVDQAVRPPEPPPALAPPPRGGRAVWGGALVLLGGLWALSNTGVAIPWGLVVPSLLVGLGALLLVVRDRGAADALVGSGIVVLVAALLVPGIRTVSIVSAGERAEQPTTVAELEPAYELGAGSLTLDLRSLDLGDGVTTVVANVGMGELVVQLPADVEVTGRAAAGIGEVVVLERVRSGVAPDLRLPEATGSDVLQLDLRVGLGSIEVVQEVGR